MYFTCIVIALYQNRGGGGGGGGGGEEEELVDVLKNGTSIYLCYQCSK